MTHSCKTILRKIIKLSNKSCTLLCIHQENSIAKYGKKFTEETGKGEYINCSKYRGELKAIIQCLVDDGYLEEPYAYTFQLTHKGLHYKEYQFEEIKLFLLRSILTPIVVSMATTLLTLWITWLIQR